VKLNPDRLVANLKACLVAKGYSQVHEMDYQEIFSPVAKLTSLRILVFFCCHSSLAPQSVRC